MSDFVREQPDQGASVAGGPQADREGDGVKPAKPDIEELVSLFVLRAFAVTVIAVCFALPGWAWVRVSFFPWERHMDSAEYEIRELGAFVVVCLLAFLSSIKITRMLIGYWKKVSQTRARAASESSRSGSSRDD